MELIMDYFKDRVLFYNTDKDRKFMLLLIIPNAHMTWNPARSKVDYSTQADLTSLGIPLLSLI